MHKYLMKLIDLFESKQDTLYVSRPLLNAEEVWEWARKNGCKTPLEPEDMHVTIAHSKTPVDWLLIRPKKRELDIPETNDRKLLAFGEEETTIVLSFESKKLEDRWMEFCSLGAKWDFPEYIPHVSITYNSEWSNWEDVMPYSGELILGPEKFEPFVDNWSEDKN